MLTPTQEAQRLQALASYAQLDTAPEEDFDQIARMAAELCGVPMAAVSLVDDHRQWFKARVGLDVCETSRDTAFCAHTIQEDRVLIVPDASLDPRFADNPLVTGAPFIRFYAGVPLTDKDGHNLGSLCVIDRRPRELPPATLRMLGHLARQVTVLFELRRLARQLGDALRLVDDLSKLLPICSYCKDVRGEDGQWFRIERYLSQNRVRTTHGMCPTCKEKHFGEFLQDRGNRS